MAPFDGSASAAHLRARTAEAPKWRDRQASADRRPFAHPDATAARKSTEESRARLSFVLLVYLVAIVSLLQLSPLEFGLRSDVRLVAMTDWRDALTAFALFLPLGFLYPLTRTLRRTSAVHVALWGGLMAALLAGGRTWEVNRDTAIVDIIASALGAGVGGMLLQRVNDRTLRSRLVNRLSLEIPLAGLVYLLLGALIATSASAAGDDARRLLALPPLGLLAARLLAGLYEHHFGPARVCSRRGMSLIAVAWTMLGLSPVMIHHPLFALWLALLVGGATFYHASRPAVHMKERRFESDVLKAAMPYVAVYFLDVVFLPLVAGIDRWHLSFGLAGASGDAGSHIVPLLACVTSLTLLGYMLAETRGRRELPFARVALRVALECGGVAIAIEASRGFQRGGGASVLECLLMIAAAILGAGMYHHQRDRVRWLLIHRVTAAAPKRRARAWVRMAD